MMLKTSRLILRPWNENDAEQLRTNGGEARFVFWDVSLNKTMKL